MLKKKLKSKKKTTILGGTDTVVTMEEPKRELQNKPNLNQTAESQVRSTARKGQDKQSKETASDFILVWYMPKLHPQ